MTFSSTQRITKTPTKKRNVLSRDGGEFSTKKENKDYGHRQARNNKKANQLSAWGE